MKSFSSIRDQAMKSFLTLSLILYSVPGHGQGERRTEGVARPQAAEAKSQKEEDDAELPKNPPEEVRKTDEIARNNGVEFEKITSDSNGKPVSVDTISKSEMHLGFEQANQFKLATAPEKFAGKILADLEIKRTIHVYNDRAVTERLKFSRNTDLSPRKPRMSLVKNNKEYAYDPETGQVESKDLKSPVKEPTLYLGFSKNHQPQIHSELMIKVGLHKINQMIRDEELRKLANEEWLYQSLKNIHSIGNPAARQTVDTPLPATSKGAPSSESSVEGEARTLTNMHAMTPAGGGNDPW